MTTRQPDRRTPGPTGLLDRGREAMLTRRAHQGDRAAVDELISSHLRYVVRIARRYRASGSSLDDLVQEGMIGLLRAIERFNPDRGARLATYAMWWIRASIQEHVMRSWSLVRVGTSAAQRTVFFNLRSIAADLRVSVDQISEELLAAMSQRFDVPLREIRRLANRMAQHDRSLNTRVAADGEQGDEWIDRIADTGPTPEEAMAARSEKHFLGELLGKALAALPDRERHIIQCRYLSEAAATRDAIARELGVSKERVRQLEIRALERLRGMLPTFGFEGDIAL